MSLSIPVCATCGNATFPQLFLCPSCAGTTWRYEPVERGHVEGSTVNARDGVHVGLVRVALGPLVVARVEGAAEVGDEVALDQDGLVPVARPI
ncbi:MAG: rubredoxin [Actinomycetota bacterium]|nr:rubredoxin [Actinomycetota bacterium]